MIKSLEQEKRKFAEKEILFLVFQSALNRGFPVYNKKADVEKKKKFKAYLSERLKEWVEKCKGKEYVSVLTEFQNDINKSEHKIILKNHKITFGRVQKLLNLYLKYHWTFGFDKKEPPHCPIDSIILGKIKWPGPSWTNPKFDVEKYKEAIDKCKKKADKKSVVEWELFTFRNRTDLDISI